MAAENEQEKAAAAIRAKRAEMAQLPDDQAVSVALDYLRKNPTRGLAPFMKTVLRERDKSAVLAGFEKIFGDSEMHETMPSNFIDEFVNTFGLKDPEVQRNLIALLSVEDHVVAGRAAFWLALAKQNGELLFSKDPDLLQYLPIAINNALPATLEDLTSGLYVTDLDFELLKKELEVFAKADPSSFDVLLLGISAVIKRLRKREFGEGSAVTGGLGSALNVLVELVGKLKRNTNDKKTLSALVDIMFDQNAGFDVHELAIEAYYNVLNPADPMSPEEIFPPYAREPPLYAYYRRHLQDPPAFFESIYGKNMALTALRARLEFEQEVRQAKVEAIDARISGGVHAAFMDAISVGDAKRAAAIHPFVK